MSLAELESHTRRVTAEDLAQVTPEQIEQVLKTVSRDQIRVVMRSMVENHRTGEVLAKTPMTNFNTSLEHITTEQLAESALQMQANPAFQAELLDGMTDDHRARCTEHLQRRQASRNKK